MHNPRPVLVIDDEESIREVLKQALELDSYRVLTAAHGQEGLEALERGELPCLILVDLMMPVMDGWEFVQEVRKRPTLSRIPIIVVSAYSEKAWALEVEGVIPKPFDITVLLDTVNRYCG